MAITFLATPIQNPRPGACIPPWNPELRHDRFRVLLPDISGLSGRKAGPAVLSDASQPGRRQAEVQHVSPHLHLSFLVEYLMPHAGIKDRRDMPVAGLAHLLHSRSEPAGSAHARIIGTGDEHHREIRRAALPAFEAVCVLHEPEKVKEAVCRELECTQGIPVIRPYNFRVVADPCIMRTFMSEILVERTERDILYEPGPVMPAQDQSTGGGKEFPEHKARDITRASAYYQHG